MFFFEHHGMGGEYLFRVYNMPTESFSAHLHRAYEIILVKKGILRVQVEQKQYVLKQGELVFVFGNQIHSFVSAEKTDIEIVLFSPEMIGDFYSVHKDYIPQNNVLHPSRMPDFEDLKTVYAQKSVLYSICDDLLANTKMEPIGNRSQVLVLQQIFSYVDKHFGEDCSLKTVAQALQYDYAYLSKLFTRLAGIHFTEYLNNYRIAQVCYLLKGERCSISDIAERCGYTTLRTFHRNFRLVMRCSPREFIAQSSIL